MPNTHWMYLVQSDGYCNFVICNWAHTGLFGHNATVVVVEVIVVGVTVVVGVAVVGIVVFGYVVVGVVVVSVVVDGVAVDVNAVVVDGVAVVEEVVEVPLQLRHLASAGSMHSVATGLNSWPLGHCIILENPITHCINLVQSAG